MGQVFSHCDPACPAPTRPGGHKTPFDAFEEIWMIYLSHEEDISATRSIVNDIATDATPADAATVPLREGSPTAIWDVAEAKAFGEKCITKMKETLEDEVVDEGPSYDVMTRSGHIVLKCKLKKGPRFHFDVTYSRDVSMAGGTVN